MPKRTPKPERKSKYASKRTRDLGPDIGSGIESNIGSGIGLGIGPVIGSGIGFIPESEYIPKRRLNARRGITRLSLRLRQILSMILPEFGLALDQELDRSGIRSQIGSRPVESRIVERVIPKPEYKA
jgi:hypothetical protein